MLKKADESFKNDILSFCDGSLLGTRISCYVSTYGFEKNFIEFYLYYNEDKLIGVMAKFEDSITLLLKEYQDFSEVTTFINMLAFTTLTCNVDILSDKANFNFEAKNCYKYVNNIDICEAEEITHDYYKDMYNLISRNIPYSFANSTEAYFSFLSDFTYRERRNSARAKGIIIGDKLCACGITAAETDTSALLSGIASDSECRGMGFGKKVVLSLVSELKKENKSAYVIALNSTAEKFYEHIGFENCGEIYIYKRNF